MPIGTLKAGRVSHKRGRHFDYNPPKPTILMPVGKIEFVPCYYVAPIMGTKTAIYRKVARGVTKRLMVFDNSRITNRMRFAYAQGA